MAGAITVANKVLEIAKAQGKPLTPLQLMKLVYMCQGWSLALLKAPLYPDSIEAWRYGPVIPSLYRAVRQFGSNVITEPLTGLTAPGALSDAQIDLITSVVDAYGHLSGGALSNLTHKPESPWSKVWAEGYDNLPIPTDLIRTHYEKLLTAKTVTAA